MIVTPKPREQTRARYPDEEGYVERDGVRVFYEVYGDAPTTFLLFPTSPISHSRLWKAQIPYLSRHFRVITFDPRGNGRSDRPDTAEAYSYWEFVVDGRAILEATRTETALLAGICDGGGWALMLAATQPATAQGVVAIAPCVPRLTPSQRLGNRLLLASPLTLVLVVLFFSTFVPTAAGAQHGVAGLTQRLVVIEVLGWFVAMGRLAFRRS